MPLRQSERSADDDKLRSGGTVELRTGFVLERGKVYDQGMLNGFTAWLEYSGVQESGIPVGNGRVVVNHRTEYATYAGSCTTYLEAAERLIREHKASLSCSGRSYENMHAVHGRRISFAFC